VTKKQGDRRGLNPRQLEPQSTSHVAILHTCVTETGQTDSSPLAQNHTGRTGYGNGSGLVGTSSQILLASSPPWLRWVGLVRCATPGWFRHHSEQRCRSREQWAFVCEASP
jgi:hypothetical protein